MTLTIPGYKILRTLGKGGMATVYLAEQEIFERQVALKVMSRALADDPSFGQRFLREARIVSQLVHPHIVTVHDAGVHEGHYFLSMQYIDGEDLKQARRKLSLRQKIRVIREIATALEYAASKGYVHRDIKPENILFHTSDGRAVLTDFGIARAAETDLAMTQTGTAIGTPHYMSPEQAKGQSVDHRADIYSLGVVFYLLLSGGLPYEAESAVAIGIKHITEPVPLLPAELNSLQPIIDKMMAKQVTARYQRAAELVDDLDALDMDVLEHAVSMAEGSLRRQLEDSDADAPTVVARAVTDSGRDTQVREDDTEDDFTLVYDDDEQQKSSWLPWVAGLLILGSVAGGVFYQQQPEQVHRWYDQAVAQWQSWMNSDAVSEDMAVEVQPEPEATPANTPQQEPESSAAAEMPSTQTEPAEGLAGSNAQPLPPEKGPAPEVLAAQERLAQLKASLPLEPAVLPELAQAYRELIELSPDDEAVAAEYQRLREDQRDAMLALAAEGKTDLALSRLQQFRTVFDGLSEQAYLDLEQQINTSAKVAELLPRAEAHFEADRLTRPEDDNAVVLYRQILAVDPDHELARQRLKEVAVKLADYGSNALNSGQPGRAKSFVEKAQELAPDAPEVVALAADIDQREQRAERREALETSAEQALAEGDFYRPASTSAYAFYRQLQDQFPDNGAGAAGLQKTFDAFASRVNQQIAMDEFDLAREMVSRALQAAPASERLQTYSVTVDERIAEILLSREPRITELVVSGQPISDPGVPQTAQISADRSVYIAIRFENFGADTAVIQAELKDATESLELAQVPVIVSGEGGVASFSIDRPVEGFSSGSYTIIMRFDNEVLHKSVFRVAN